MIPADRPERPRPQAATEIRLDDLLPRKNVVGGKSTPKVLFGASTMRPAGHDRERGR